MRSVGLLEEYLAASLQVSLVSRDPQDGPLVATSSTEVNFSQAIDVIVPQVWTMSIRR